MAWYGNARHPATDTPAPDAQGPACGNNASAQIALTYGASAQAVQAASLGLATNTGSPMSRGTRTWGGDAGYGVHRFSGRLALDPHSPTAGAVSPVSSPLAASVRYGTGGGPSQPSGYPSAGAISNFAQINALDMNKLGNLGYGG
jgi:hypothetical protein